MWFSKPKSEEVSGKTRRELEEELAAANKVIAKVNESLTACTPMIDFDTMRVFSIERMASKNRPSTVIGYYMEEPVYIDTEDGKLVQMRDVVHEWTLYCNDERHEELVKKYIDWKKNNLS